MKAKTEEEAKSIDKLVGRTIKLKAESHRPEAPEYYQGKLERFMTGHRIFEPLKVYPDGARRQIDGFRAVRQRDLDEGRVEVVKQPVQKLY